MFQVIVNEGTLEGEQVKNEFGGTFYSFKGIPYAEPPVGDLRFKAPKLPRPWKGVRSAKEFGSVCYQVDFALKDEPVGSEDCLYLNVYTPDIKSPKPFPVMVYIHGGAFMSGSGNDNMHGPEFLIRDGIILVTINYRLGALGFLCLETQDIPGNAGMKDQVAALRWVNKNIKSFGGDPSNVTICGESAGAGSVSFHLVSPMSKGLFKRAIPQSGASPCNWANSFKPRDRAISFAKNLGFYSEDDKELYEFFKSLPVESFINLFVPYTLSESAAEKIQVFFTIVSEKEFVNTETFFHGEIFDVLRNGIHEGVDVMAGYTADEGYVCLVQTDLQKTIAQINKMNDFLTPKYFAINCPMKTQIDVGKRIKDFYFKKGEVTIEDLGDYIKYLSMEMFVYGIYEQVKFIVKNKKNKVYFYKFTCKTERNFCGEKYLGLGDIIGDKKITCHSDDLAYIFPMKFAGQKIDVNSSTFEIVNNVTRLWTNFVKYGNPTPDDSLGVKWHPYSLENQDYLDIGNQFVAQTEPDKEEFQFWENIFREFFPHYVYQ